MNSPHAPRWPTYAGLFTITLATLMYEILLTRIFSVTMWYHFAFMVVSITLFGITVGAILVYAFPGRFPHERVRQQLATGSLLFSLSIVVSFLIHRQIPFNPDVSLGGYLSVASVFVLFTIPFVFGGIVVTLALTRFPKQIGKLYAADLIGAAAGCLLLLYALELTDGPTAVMLVGGLAAVAAVLFAQDAAAARLLRGGAALSVVLGLFVVGNTALARNQASLIRLLWVKGQYEEPPLYEKWNSFSRIRVTGDAQQPQTPESWGIDPALADQYQIPQLRLDIDADAATVLTAFDGNLQPLEYLRYDVTNLAHYIRPQARVLVVGSGGGRDVLSAVVFGQTQVVAVELNRDILDVANNHLGDFTGHLDRRPSVRFVNDEARSYLERSEDRFDILQLSLTDTWAATAAGAFVLSENSLYTLEAWQTFLQRLTPDGVLSVSRWYDDAQPGEIYRLTALAAAALMQQGVQQPRDHLVIVRSIYTENDGRPLGIGTLLASRSAFSDGELDTIEEASARARLEVVLSPRRSADETLARIASGQELEELAASLPIRIEPPTDDSPFFFNMVGLGAAFRPEAWGQGISASNLRAVFILGGLLVTVVLLSALCILVPLILGARVRRARLRLQRSTPLFVYFGAIGLGFMLVEISQLQRLIIFLGHPTYGLSVVLFSLLLFSGLGSSLTQRLSGPRPGSRGLLPLSLLLGALVLFGLLTPAAVAASRAATTPLRILVAVAMLAPIGLFMGMALPLGMRAAARHWDSLTPWLWGINGAASVSASVLAVAIALSSSISTAFWAGAACYLVAFAAFARIPITDG